ncbi:RNA polymerase sigma factor SigX [Bacillaceae bacterium S4-13-58]
MQEVFEDLYDKYHHDLFQFLFYMVRNKQLAEDLSQEVYINIIKSYDSFKGNSSEKTWIFSIARHAAIDYFRGQKRRKKHIMDLFDIGENSPLIQDSDPIPEEMAVQNEEIKEIYECLEHCTIDQKTVIILRYIQDLSIQETAEILGWSLSKVKTTQHRGMKALRTLLEQKVGEEGVRREAKEL